MLTALQRFPFLFGSLSTNPFGCLSTFNSNSALLSLLTVGVEVEVRCFLLTGDRDEDDEDISVGGKARFKNTSEPLSSDIILT